MENQNLLAEGFLRLSTVKNLPQFFPMLDLTESAIRGHIFKAKDRFDSRGRRIPGNGLNETGAIMYRGRKILIDVDRYALWLSSGAQEE